MAKKGPLRLNLPSLHLSRLVQTFSHLPPPPASHNLQKHKSASLFIYKNPSVTSTSARHRPGRTHDTTRLGTDPASSGEEDRARGESRTRESSPPSGWFGITAVTRRHSPPHLVAASCGCSALSVASRPPPHRRHRRRRPRLPRRPGSCDTLSLSWACGWVFSAGYAGHGIG